MVESRKLRMGNSFIALRDRFKTELEPRIGRKLTDAEITNSIAHFLEDENLHTLMLNRAKRRRGLF